MPENISTKHKNRIFPFEFYDELHENLSEYGIYNPAFILKDILKTTDGERKKMFNENNDVGLINQLNKNNILEIEPFGEVLIICLVYEKKDTHVIIGNDKDKRSLIPLSMLVGQLYDSAGLPVFSKDVDEKSIKQIPEVLWDDPNLLLAVASMADSKNEEAQVGVIKIPKSIEQKLFESTENN